MTYAYRGSVDIDHTYNSLIETAYKRYQPLSLIVLVNSDINGVIPSTGVSSPFSVERSLANSPDEVMSFNTTRE